MMTAQILARASTYWPRLAATAVICWSLGATGHVHDDYRWSPFHVVLTQGTNRLRMGSSSQQQSLHPGKNMKVLSDQDETLYRSAFEAQERLEWQDADIALSHVQDKSLVGHVMADRYGRRGTRPDELRAWLASYASLPEAADIYAQARALPLAKGVALTQPAVMDQWSGASGYGASFGFRAEGFDGTTSIVARHFMSKINAALHRGEPNVAKALFVAERTNRNIPAQELSDIQSRIAAGFFYEGEVVAARQMVNDALQNPNPLALWIYGLSAWRQGDYTGAEHAFGLLSTQQGLSTWDYAAADYWAYRSAKHSGERTQANYWLKQAANQPHSFYGFLAAHLLGRDVPWSWSLPAWDETAFNTLASHPEGQRALALLQVGQTSLAELELRHLNPQGQHELQSAMLALSEKAGLPSLTMQLGGMAINDNGKPYDAALYPVPPWQPSQGFTIDRALLYAMMRHESQFDPQAISGSGACGLMQLMPTTAHLVANDNAQPFHECSEQLLDPVYNIELGQKYVGHLVRQPMIGDNLLVLLAAYNSGPNKAMRWVKDTEGTDPLLFLESIPVRETRDYVQQVLMHYWTYRARLAQPETSLAQLAHGQWPRFTTHDLARSFMSDVEKPSFAIASSQK